jgi:hypothetical protein
MPKSFLQKVILIIRKCLHGFLLVLSTFSSPIPSSIHCDQGIHYLSTSAIAKTKINSECIIANLNTMSSGLTVPYVQGDMLTTSPGVVRYLIRISGYPLWGHMVQVHIFTPFEVRASRMT